MVQYGVPLTHHAHRWITGCALIANYYRLLAHLITTGFYKTPMRWNLVCSALFCRTYWNIVSSLVYRWMNYVEPFFSLTGGYQWLQLFSLLPISRTGGNVSSSTYSLTVLHLVCRLGNCTYGERVFHLHFTAQKETTRNVYTYCLKDSSTDSMNRLTIGTSQRKI